jgi:molybdopterin-dependent oxidoreductase alpha subunit
VAHIENGGVTVLRTPARGLTPRLWASWKPFGIGERRPNNYLEIARAAWENRDRPGYAWRILRHGVCDGCALGTAGMRDWTLPGVHLCNVRLRLLRLNTQPALDPSTLADVTQLETRSSRELRRLGRLGAPMLRRHGDRGFTRIGWEQAYELMARRVAEAAPQRLAFYLTSRGMPNESYYAVQKAVRALGTNSVDNAARVCHSPSTSALKQAIGVSATTCSYQDWIGTDLVVFIGANVANNQPVATKYLHYAKKAGTRVAVVNTYREPGMDRYWVPSVPESALFGTRIADRFFLVDTGGDGAFLAGALKALIAGGGVDREFVERHTSGFEATAAAAAATSWSDLEAAGGTTRAEMEAFAGVLAGARRAVLVWSMGVTQHECGEDSVRGIVNLALARGFLGRPGCGLMPIRGHSGVQGGAEMGAYATALPGGVAIDADSRARFADLWGFQVPAARGLAAPEMIDAAGAGELDVLFSAGGNFLEILPDPGAVREALARVPLRVHMDLVLTSQMLVPGAEVLLLPAATRYEIPGGVTETSTERRVIFSPEIKGPRVPEGRPEFEVLGELAARVRPDLADHVRFAGTPAIREEIARVIPFYDGIQRLGREGDSFQYGGPHLCPDGVCPTPDGRGRFAPYAVGVARPADGNFRLSTRRGKQFNSMVQEDTDALTGAARDDVLINPEDAGRLGLANGAAVRLRSATGEFRGRLRLAPVKPGNLQVHWPEGNVLVAGGVRSPVAGIPDYNALVTIERC